MKKNIFILSACFTVVLFLLVSCKKENNTTPPPKTKTQLITQATWRFSVATVGGTDVSGALQACQKDNIMTFVAVGLTGTIDEGPTKCNGGDPQTRPFTWSFNVGETMLNVSATLFTGGSSTFTLVSLSETQLILSQTITVGGTPQNAVVTFVH